MPQQRLRSRKGQRAGCGSRGDRTRFGHLGLTGHGTVAIQSRIRSEWSSHVAPWLRRLVQPYRRYTRTQYYILLNGIMCDSKLVVLMRIMHSYARRMLRTGRGPGRLRLTRAALPQVRGHFPWSANAVRFQSGASMQESRPFRRPEHGHGGRRRQRRRLGLQQPDHLPHRLAEHREVRRRERRPTGLSCYTVNSR
jgi:hypothetical protein